jgi:ATP phosphoribosyltransferase
MPAMLDGRGFGFMGSDTFEELSERTQSELAYEPITENGASLTLGIPEYYAEKPPIAPLKIATKYPNMAARCLARLGMEYEISLQLGGSLELAPYFTVCNAIVDIVKSGETMAQNGIEVVSTLEPIMIGAVWKK